MKGLGYRSWYLTAGVLALSVLAFGLTTEWAPARDANTPKSGQQWLSDSEREQVGKAVMEQVRAEGLPVIQLDNPAHVSPIQHAPVGEPGFITTAHGERIRLITKYEAEPIAGSGLATGGATPNGGACTCDSECAAAPGECKVAQCVGGVCVQENAPVDMTCALDANFCTEDRCNDAGVCVAKTVSTTSAVALSPCAKQCCTAAACTLGSFQNCFDGGDCPGTEGCFPKRQVDGPATYIATCDEANDRCFVDAQGGAVEAVGRCCTGAGAGTCTEGVSEATCTGGGGRWWRWRDPDDSLHLCSASRGCPKYSSGIAPDGAHITGIGPVVPFARRCSIGGGRCEVNSDCITRCSGGANANESCDVDAECPGGTCANIDTCVADPDECQGPATFTSIGDDYSLANGSYMRLEEFRFRGGAREPNEVVVFDIYDSSFSPPRLVNAFAFRLLNPGDFDYRLIVDCGDNCDLTQPQGSVAEEEPDDPPLIIPPNGFIVMRAGATNAAAGVDDQFGEDDGNLFWYSTDTTDVGTNDVNSMWVNGVVGPNGAIGNDVLSFELLGEKLSNPPLAACCDPTTGVCTDRLQWDCAFCTDPGRTPCQRGRDCGLNDQFLCSTRDWKGARTRLQVDADAYRDCAGTYCFNPGNPNPNTITPCTGGPGQGTCPMGQTCESPCEVAACCTPGGCIEVTSASACTMASGTLLGFGQKCTPDCCPSGVSTGVDCCKDYYTCHLGGNNTTNICNFRCSNDANRPCTADYECDSPGTCNVMAGAQADCPAGQTCDQVCDGPDSEADPRIHSVDVPTFNDVNDPPLVINFEGITTPANFFDDCALGGADFGWYEIFTIGKADANDACAQVTLNFCCSDPIITPVQVALGKDCPCAGGETIFADNDVDGQQAGFGSACNNDFCCTDGNFSVQWTVPAGTYVYGIVADNSCSNGTAACFDDSDCNPGTWCARNNSQYQGHLIIKPCPPGACCGAPADPGENFCSVTDRFTCQEERKYCKTNQMPCTSAAQCPLGDSCLAGVFLGDKEVSPVPECVGNPCNLGACCVGPGNCQDAGGAGVNFATCNAQNGSFLGGLRCMDNPCPVCPIETQDQCQTALTGQFIFPCDRFVGIRRADDFKPAGTTIRRICFFPCFLGVTGDGIGFECTATPPPDAYIAKFYEDDNGVPGPLVAGVPGAGLALTIDAKLNSDPGGGSRCWRYTAPILPPAGLSVTPGDCYWLEVTGLGELQQGGLCLQHILSSADGNNFSMRDVDGSYAISDFDKNDHAWCIDSGVIGATSPPNSQDGGCGNFEVACCRPDGPDGDMLPDCVDGGTYTQCVGTNQAPTVGFPFPFITCSELAGMGGCPTPDNDLCDQATEVCAVQSSDPNLGVCSVSEGPPNIMEVCDMTLGSPPRHDCANSGATCQPRPANTDAYRCQFSTDNRLATTDGPNMNGAGASCQSGVNSFQADIWYDYTAPCNGVMTVHNCGPNKTYDSMMQVFSNDTPGACLACPIANQTNNKACSDDNCGTSGSGSAVRLNVVDGACYKIRLGGWSQVGSPADAGQSISGLDIGVVCNPIGGPETPDAATGIHARTKNRYISFIPDPDNAMNMESIAYRVVKTALAANAGFCVGAGSMGAACTGAPAQGTCAAGQLCTSPFPGGSPAHSCWVGTPIQTAGADQFTAICSNTPVFRVWTEPVVHVGDCEIIPTSTYQIFANVPGPIENPVPLTVGTIPMPYVNSKQWGDLVGSNNGIEWTPPNLLTNVSDVLAIQAFISGALIRPHFTVASQQAVSAADPCLNPQVNVGDVLINVRAIAGDRYGPPNTTKPINLSTCAGAPTMTCACCGN